MPYTKTTFNSGIAPGIDAAVLNTMQTQYDEATQSFGPDTLSAFVLVGGVGTIHGGLPKQMDVTACTYYALQADNTLRRRVVNATFFTTVTASATYFLDYNADGSTSWATTHSGAANYLTIASVTTDGSGNISVITDTRNIMPNLFPAGPGNSFIQHRGQHLAYVVSAGGGNPGQTVWVGTADPGSSAYEGDVWCKG